MSRHALTTFEKDLLDAIQQAIPLTERPFAELARRLGTTEPAVIETLTRLKNDAPIIRQISAIFDTKALGYQSSLVAARYDEGVLDERAAIISAHPGVSHNYRREHAYNLWYTLAVPPDSRLGLDRTIARLHELSRAIVTRKMETLKLFKIGVRLDIRGGHGTAAHEAFPAYDDDDRQIAQTHPLSADDIAAIRILQRDLPLVPEPFAALAAEADLTADSLLAAATRFLEHKQMRRFAAVLRHREAGFAHNCMGVWNVPDDHADEVGTAMARFQAVSHCYRRPRFDDWPYNIFTMVHGRTRDECLSTLGAIAEATGIRERAELWSVKEYKKTRVVYFNPDTEAWEG